MNSNLIQHVSYVSENVLIMMGIFPDLEIREEQQQVSVRFIREIEADSSGSASGAASQSHMFVFFCAIVVVVIATHVLLFELRD